MPKQQTDYLFQLIKSLSKAEKRNFRLYVNRKTNGEEAKFLQLFDILEKQNEYNEDEILKKAKYIKPRQLSNLKAHLYKQLLKSLRLQQANNDHEINIREGIDYAKVLYNKGLYKQSLKILEKTKNTAIRHQKPVLQYEIIEFEKLIELQYITRSIENRADELTDEANNTGDDIVSARKYSNLALKLYSLYLKVGSVRNKKDMLMVSQFFSSHFHPPQNINQCSFYEKLYIYQSYVWYYNIIQDFVRCYKYSRKWVELFRENPGMIHNQTDLYLKGINNLLVSLHMTRYHSMFKEELDKLINLPENEDIPLNDNNLLLYNLFRYTHLINYHFLEGTFTEGTTLIPEINKYIENNRQRLDNHRVLVFYYKIASLYFGSGDYRKAILYLNHILNYKDTTLRGDIHSFSRLLNLVSHYELGNDDLIEYQVKSTYRFLYKMENLQEVQKHILSFLRKLSRIEPGELKNEFKKLHEKFVSLENNPFEKRAFYYLDMISWLESKIENRPVQDIIRQKAIKEKENSNHVL
ncbi:MAG: hypothetical protein R6U04_02955 [Bacteroidales bacterium]